MFILTHFCPIELQSRGGKQSERERERERDWGGGVMEGKGGKKLINPSSRGVEKKRGEGRRQIDC